MDEKNYQLRDERDEKRRHPEQEQPLRGDETPPELIGAPVVIEQRPETD